MKKEKTKDGVSLKKTITGMLELPKEIVYNLPLISITGNESLEIENYKGVIEYTESRVRINTTCGILVIEGRKLDIRQITSEHMLIAGHIFKFEYCV